MELLNSLVGALSTALATIATTGGTLGSLLILSVTLNCVLVYRYVRLATRISNEQNNK